MTKIEDGKTKFISMNHQYESAQREYELSTEVKTLRNSQIVEILKSLESETAHEVTTFRGEKLLTMRAAPYVISELSDEKPETSFILQIMQLDFIDGSMECIGAYQCHAKRYPNGYFRMQPIIRYKK